MFYEYLNATRKKTFIEVVCVYVRVCVCVADMLVV